jgi:hypothetical protein
MFVSVAYMHVFLFSRCIGFVSELCGGLQDAGNPSAAVQTAMTSVVLAYLNNWKQDVRPRCGVLSPPLTATTHIRSCPLPPPHSGCKAGVLSLSSPTRSACHYPRVLGNGCYCLLVFNVLSSWWSWWCSVLCWCIWCHVDGLGGQFCAIWCRAGLAVLSSLTFCSGLKDRVMKNVPYFLTNYLVVVR